MIRNNVKSVNSTGSDRVTCPRESVINRIIDFMGKLMLRDIIHWSAGSGKISGQVALPGAAVDNRQVIVAKTVRRFPEQDEVERETANRGTYCSYYSYWR
jgi:hypothetical protein